METRPSRPVWQALAIAWELGYSIALPLVFFALAGRWADRHFHTSPWLLLAGVVIAMVSSTILLVRKFSRLVREAQPPSSHTS